LAELHTFALDQLLLVVVVLGIVDLILILIDLINCPITDGSVVPEEPFRAVFFCVEVCDAHDVDCFDECKI